MAILFKCQNCQIQLSVPDNAEAKRAQCGKCDHVNSVPVGAKEIVEGEPVDTAAAPIEFNKRYSVKSAINGAVFGPADMETLKRWRAEGRITPNCQFQEEGSELWTHASQMFSNFQDHSQPHSDNPFQSPVNMALGADQYMDQRHDVTCHDQVIPKRSDLGFCFSHSKKVWQDNFGLMVGAFVVLAALAAVTSIPASFIYEAFPPFSFVSIVTELVLTVVIGFLSIGFVKMYCQLARRKPGEIKQLFQGSKHAVLALLYVFVSNIPVEIISYLFEEWSLDLVNGIMPTEGQLVTLTLLSIGYLLFSLVTWPIYYLLIDTDLGMKSFSTGLAIAQKNILQSLVVWAGVLFISFVGLLLCLVGGLFTAPLAIMLQAVAYLNMSGQLEPRA